jgi:TonB dependent receptor/TonB-dependent Receptor Plug Domain
LYSTVAASKSFLLCFFCFVVFPSVSQVAVQPLKNILPDLENRYSVTFSYADESINDISIPPPQKKITLENALRYLSEKTGLAFNKISDRYISISVSTSNTTTICGTLLSRDTNEKISGATIQSASGMAVSNERGYFEMKNVSRDDVLLIRFVGYLPTTMPAKEFNGQDCSSIALQPQFISLEEVVVTDFITEGIEKRMDGAFEIHGATLGILPGLTEPDVMQTIQALPGIESISESISDINVRGGTNDQNLVLWDGIKMYQTGHFFGLISAFNPYITTRGTLTKNGTSSMLGEGISSTLNFTTDDHLSEKISGGGGFNLINSDFFVKLPLTKKLSLQFASRRSITDLVLTPTYKNYYDRVFKNTEVVNGQDSVITAKEKFNFYDVSVKLLYDITPKDKLRFSFLNISNDLEFQETLKTNGSTVSKTSSLAQQSLATGLSYTRMWNDRLKTTAQAYHSRYNLDAINQNISSQQQLSQGNDVLDTGLKFDAHIKLNGKLDLLSGYQYFDVSILNFDEIDNPLYLRVVKQVLVSHAGFVECNADLGDKTSARFGVRANFFPKFSKTIIEPRLSVSRRFGTNFHWEILGEMKNQTNAQIIDFQNDFLGVEKRRWVLSNNSDIPIIRSKQVSTGIHYNKDNLLMSVDGYYKFVDGIITSSQGFIGQYQNVRSTGSYKTSGVDFLINQKFNHVTAWFSYSVANNSYTFDQLTPSIFPHNLDIRHMAGFGANYKTGRVEIATGLNWRTGKPFTQPVPGSEIINNNINFDLPNSARLSNYLRMDLSARYYFHIGKKLNAQTGISIWNVLNNQNPINRFMRSPMATKLSR